MLAFSTFNYYYNCKITKFYYNFIKILIIFITVLKLKPLIKFIKKIEMNLGILNKKFETLLEKEMKIEE